MPLAFISSTPSPCSEPELEAQEEPKAAIVVGFHWDSWVLTTCIHLPLGIGGNSRTHSSAKQR